MSNAAPETCSQEQPMEKDPKNNSHPRCDLPMANILSHAFNYGSVMNSDNVEKNAEREKMVHEMTLEYQKVIAIEREIEGKQTPWKKQKK